MDWSSNEPRIDWLSNAGRMDEFVYERVNLRTGEVFGRVEGITGGTLERDLHSDVKASGSLDYVARPDVGSDFLRVSVISTDPVTGASEKLALGTYLVSTPQSVMGEGKEEGSADLYGVLQVLAEDSFDEPLVLDAGTRAVSRAAELVREAGLEVDCPESDAVLTRDAVLDEDASRLEAVNWLLDFAGFEQAQVDGFGKVRFLPQRDYAALAPTVALRADDGRCAFRREVSRELDAFSVPNVVVLTCTSAEGEPMTAVAVNDDPASPYSTASRGRRVVHRESVSDAASLEALMSRASAVLADKTAAVESVEVAHVFVPFEMGEACDFEYAEAGLHLRGLVAVRQSLSLRPPPHSPVRR